MESKFTAVIKKKLADLVHVHIKLFNRKSITSLKKVKKISNLCEVLNKKSVNKKCLSELHKLLQILYGMALVPASAERSFYTRRIKLWLRSTMTDTVSIFECCKYSKKLVEQY